MPTLQAVMGHAAASPSLTVADVDTAFQSLKTVKGKGSSTARQAQLGDLFGKATAEEQDFLLRLIVGELRQGALEGVMLEAVAAAADIPAAEVRRAATLAGGIPQVARAALSGAGLAALLHPLDAAGAARCWRNRPRTSRPRSRTSAPRCSNGSSTARASRCTSAASEVRVFTRNLNDVTSRVPEVRRRGENDRCAI